MRRFVPEPFNVEHIVPISRGGKTHLRNLAWACAGCNYFKHNKMFGIDPVNDNTIRLFNPRRQRWWDHFKWSEDATLMLGLTSTGRATVIALQLNREELINLRWALNRLGIHPLN